MIFYFSGTGNSEWVAKELGKQLNDEVISIVEATRKGPTGYFFGENTTLGLVFPVYAWTPPQVVMDFIRDIKCKGAYTYAVCTCAEEAGNALKVMSKHLHLDSGFSLSMPNNYIIGSDVDSREVEERKIAAAAAKLPHICKKIRAREHCFDVAEGSMAFLKSTVVANCFNAFARQTKQFRADERCNGCGLCEKQCPTRTIKLIENKPQWGNSCYQCLSCINRCPQKAIQYGRSTEKRERYYFGHKQA